MGAPGIFDSEDILRLTRQRAARAAGYAAGMVGLSGLTLALGSLGALSMTVVLLVLTVGWLLTGGWVARRLHALRSVAWCVRLTPEHVAGTDYVRKTTTLSWKAVGYVNLTDDALTIAGPRLTTLQVPSFMPGFERLSRTVIDQALRNGARLYLDGTPLDQAPLHGVTAVLDPSPQASDDS